MMQMLHQAGIPILTDEKRSADDSNPKGYFELDAVKRIKSDKSWVAQAQGKAVKVVAPLLPGLPVGQRYKIIYLKRSLTEILVSQQVMLGKSRHAALKNFPLQMANNLQAQHDRAISWMQQQPHVEYIELDYEQLVGKDKGVEEQLQALLKEVDFSSIWQAVDEKLYRSRLTD
jgi:hypothetical protein